MNYSDTVVDSKFIACVLHSDSESAGPRHLTHVTDFVFVEWTSFVLEKQRLGS
jgi:hypothetical protein